MSPFLPSFDCCRSSGIPFALPPCLSSSCGLLASVPHDSRAPRLRHVRWSVGAAATTRPRGDFVYHAPSGIPCFSASAFFLLHFVSGAMMLEEHVPPTSSARVARCMEAQRRRQNNPPAREVLPLQAGSQWCALSFCSRCLVFPPARRRVRTRRRETTTPHSQSFFCEIYYTILHVSMHAVPRRRRTTTRPRCDGWGHVLSVDVIARSSRKVRAPCGENSLRRTTGKHPS